MLEVIERKGPGHPDSICDRLAENLGLHLKEEYLKKYKKVLHYNVDKVLASCGQVDYKNRKMIKPVKIVFSGNATKLEGVNKILKETVEKSLKLEISRGLKYRIYNHISECSPDLSDNFNFKKCNDTSFSVGSPFTKNEILVLKIGKFLEKLAEKKEEIGTDYKIMFINGKIIIAIALRCENNKKYFLVKNFIGNKIEEMFRKKVEINTADTENFYFNTITGTSLEQGDAGMTGRGNRYNGLITPMKPMTMEAYAGKNDVTHIGRIYQKKAHEMAQKTRKKILLVNKIGRDVEKPIKFKW
jgi:S-adenosylmethionine synthetase